MWIFLFYIFFLTQGILAKLDCLKESYDDCETPTFFSYLPNDVSEYNRLCPEMPAFLRCFKEFQDECGPRLFSSKEEYDGMYGAFTDICEEGTFLNRVFTENLKCLNETFDATYCHQKMKVITNPYRLPVESIKNEYDFELPIEVMCLQDILESNCIAADIGKNCGEEALEATAEFLRRSFYIEDTCAKNADYLLKNLDSYNLNQEQKVLVIATLEKVILSAKE